MKYNTYNCEKQFTCEKKVRRFGGSEVQGFWNGECRMSNVELWNSVILIPDFLRQSIHQHSLCSNETNFSAAFDSNLHALHNALCPMPRPVCLPVIILYLSAFSLELRALPSATHNNNLWTSEPRNLWTLFSSLRWPVMKRISCAQAFVQCNPGSGGKV